MNTVPAPPTAPRSPFARLRRLLDASGAPEAPALEPAEPVLRRTADAVAELAHETEAGSHRRDRLLSALVFLAGVALLLGAPFALKAASDFLVPVAAGFVVAVVLVPALEWMLRRRVPNDLAALLATLGFVAIAFGVLTAIVLPAVRWVQLLPSRIDQIRATLAPVLNAFAALERLSEQLMGALGAEGAETAEPTGPTSVLSVVSSAPVALVQVFFALLLVYFFLATYTRVKLRTLQKEGRSERRLELARLTRDVVSSTAAYILTISTVNVALGAVVALITWGLGMPTPLMWGGFAALFNFVPYLGPVLTAALLAVGGLIVFDGFLAAMLPSLAFIAVHAVEANYLTPSLVGRRLTMDPLAILLALSFWGWVWGTVGALISVPLLIMVKVTLDHVGKPDIMGFLFGEGTLVRSPDSRPQAPAPSA